MSTPSSHKRLARRLQAVTDRTYAQALQQVRDWDANDYADPADQVLTHEVCHHMQAATGFDIPIEIGVIDHGPVYGVQVQATPGRPQGLTVWPLDGAWGFSWYADGQTGDLLCVANVVDDTGTPLTTAACTGDDGAENRQRLLDAVAWLAAEFASHPDRMPDPAGRPAGLADIIRES